MLIVGRAVAGAGGSGIVSGIMTIIAHVIPLEKRAGRFPLHLAILRSNKINRLYGYRGCDHGDLNDKRSSDWWLFDPKSILEMVLLH